MWNKSNNQKKSFLFRVGSVWLVSLVWPIPLDPVDFSIKHCDVMLFPPTWPTLHNKQHDQRHTLKLSPDHEIALTTTCQQHRNSPASLCIWLQYILETSFAAFGWAVRAKWRLCHWFISVGSKSRNNHDIETNGCGMSAISKQSRPSFQVLSFPSVVPSHIFLSTLSIYSTE